jgi:hypothetical protein
VHELTHSAGVHNCFTPDSMNLVPVPLTWQSALYNRHPYTPWPHTRIHFSGRVGQGKGLNTRHLLQLLLKVTLSARHPVAVLPLCTEALGITVCF